MKTACSKKVAKTVRVVQSSVSDNQAKWNGKKRMISAVLRCFTSLQQMALSSMVVFQPKPSIKALSHSDSTCTIALNAFFKRPAEALVFHCPAAFIAITGNYTRRYKTNA